MELPPEQRQRIRQSTARPLIDDLATFLDASLAMISSRSELAKAIRYARSRWARNGALEINNAAEGAIRPLALGRKNYLFAGPDAGGERAAPAYTLIETAKLNSLDPQAYLREVIDRIARPSHQPCRRAAALGHRLGSPGTSAWLADPRRGLIPAQVKRASPQRSGDAYELGGGAPVRRKRPPPGSRTTSAQA
jgi:hypothetical protein